MKKHFIKLNMVIINISINNYNSIDKTKQKLPYKLFVFKHTPLINNN